MPHKAEVQADRSGSTVMQIVMQMQIVLKRMETADTSSCMEPASISNQPVTSHQLYQKTVNPRICSAPVASTFIRLAVIVPLFVFRSAAEIRLL